MEKHPEANPEMMQELRRAIRSQSNETAAARIREYLEIPYNVPLKIAITGESGSGKSSFVNAFREINENDENAAPTGVEETTTEVKEYPHPNYPNFIFSDLPGIGTTKFPAKKYLKLIEFKKFDFFIIISADRFSENDANLAKEINKMKKKFYFVRSKIDSDVRNEQRKKDFNEEKTLAQIREYCVKGECLPLNFILKRHAIIRGAHITFWPVSQGRN